MKGILASHLTNQPSDTGRSSGTRTERGVLIKEPSVHGGVRTKFFGPKDYEIDENVVGSTWIEAHEIDDIGMMGIVEKALDNVGSNAVYLSIDIDGEFKELTRKGIVVDGWDRP